MAKPGERHVASLAISCSAMLLASAVYAGAARAAEGSGAPGAPAEAGLLARWQFDPAHLRGATFPPLAGGLGATVVGPVRFSDDAPAALVLDGNSRASHRLDITDDLAAAGLPRQALAVEAWVLLDKTPRWGGIVGAFQDNGDYERGWLLGHNGSHFSFAVATAQAGRLTYLQAPAPLQAGYWYHVVGTYDGTRQKLYVDGRLVARGDEQRGQIDYPPKAFYTIGAYRDDNELYTLAGRIEQVSVYGRALSAAEVQRRFDARKKLFPQAEPPAPAADEDWPTYLHDNQRSGVAPGELALPLRPAWVHRARHAPAPAWPAPARHDYWHRQIDLPPRVTYDRAFHVTAAGGRVFFGSSAEDKVTCLDAATGKAAWSFFAEGPVRLAPTVAGDRVLFGSDDGWAYCLAAADGALLWKHRLGPVDRRLPGNERIISVFPVRTDVLVEDGVARFCAGLFPLQGVYQAAVHVATGRLLSWERITASPQGYLQYEHGRLFTPTGCDLRGAVLSAQQRRGKFTPAPVAISEYPYARIAAGTLVFGGGDGKVAAFDAEDGRELWSAEVEGRAWSLAAPRGRLLVSTDAGAIYCFTPQAKAAAAVEPPAPADVPCKDADLARRCAEAGERIAREAPDRRGYCLLLGGGLPRLAAEVAKRTEMQIVVLEADEAKVAAARRALDAAGLYGRRVAVHPGGADKLPYADYVFNVVTGEALARGVALAAPREEVLRVLAPSRGVALLGPRAEDVLRRGPLAGEGEWTHLWGDVGNTACSGETLVRPPMAIQWFGRPGPREMVDRHHRNAPPLYKAGRLFVPGDEVLFALDAYNGTTLWEARLPGSRRLGVFLDCGWMAVDERLLYVAVGPECVTLDVRSGERATAYRMPALPAGDDRRWGYVALAGEMLVGSVRKKDAAYTEVSREADAALWYDNMSLVTSDALFALDRRSGQARWRYDLDGAGVILNTTLAIGDGRAYFVESHAPAAAADRLGRMPMPTFLDGEGFLVALDLATGRVAWKRKADLSDFRLIAYLCCARGTLVLSGCRYVDKTLWYFFRGIDGATGEVKWRQSQDTLFKPGGGHGEQNRHPTIVGETVYTHPLAYDLRTGKPVEGWRFSRQGGGCGNISASASALFWRGTNPWMWDLRGGGPVRLNAVSRPGCFINIIPAGGLVLIPEASSGCTCNYPLQTSIVYAPTGRAGGPEGE